MSMQQGDITGFHHVSYTVADLDRTLSFYHDLLGFRLRSRAVYEWDEVYGASVLGNEAAQGIKVEIAVMDLNGFRVEFSHWLTPKTVQYPANPSVSGSTHLALSVKDIGEVRERLEARGIVFGCQVETFLEADRRPWRYCFFWDPDSIIVELIEEMPLNGFVETVGARIRELRQFRGLTLKQAAEQADMSTAYLSQIERGASAPSIASLAAIASALGTLPDYFLMMETDGLDVPSGANSSPGGNGTAGRKAAAPTQGGLHSIEGRVVRQELTGPDESPRITRTCYDPGSSARYEGLDPRGRLVVSVLEGTVKVDLDGVSEVLGAGKSISCDGSTFRAFSTVGEEPCVVVEVVVGSM